MVLVGLEVPKGRPPTRDWISASAASRSKRFPMIDTTLLVLMLLLVLFGL